MNIVFVLHGNESFNGLYVIHVGQYRTDDEGPMRVISGYGKNETVHFEAPPANILQSQMNLFFEWFNGYYRMDFVVHWMHESGSFICT